MAEMCDYLMIVAHLFLLVHHVSCGRWFSYRLLRSPGLSNDSATSADDCVSKCVSTSGCSAVSWRQSRGLCLKSMCNSLDLVANTGWNTYVVFDSGFVEGVDFPASHMEWMLTDTCGSNNLGSGLGPKMNLYSVTYNSSLSVYAGNAAVFAGNAASYGKTDADANVNNPLNSKSLTIMFWAYFYTAATRATFLEFSSTVSGRGMLCWVANGGLWYDWRSGTNCTGTCNGDSYTWTPSAFTWYQIAYVYDVSVSTTMIYLNGNLVASVANNRFVNKYVWDAVVIAGSPYDTTGALSGRLFCYKLFDASLNQGEIMRASQSCASSKMRLSD